MKLAIDQPTLSDALGWVAGLLPKRPAHPILGGIHLRAEDDFLELRAADTEASHAAILPASIGEPGEAVVSGYLLRGLVESLSEKSTVELDVDGADGSARELVIRQARTRCRMGLIVGDDYPAQPKMPELVGPVDVGALLEAVVSASHPIDDSTAGDDLRGIRIEATDGQLYVIGASRTTMALRSVEWHGDDFAIQAPHKPLIAALRGLQGSTRSDAEVDLALELNDDAGGLLGLDGLSSGEGSRWVTMRLYAGKPMPWRKLIRPMSGDTQEAIVSAADLSSALRRAALLAGDEPTAELVHDPAVDPEWISIHVGAAGGQGGRGYGDDVVTLTDVSSSSAGQAIRLGINPGWMADAIDAIASGPESRVRLGFDASSPMKPITIRAIERSTTAREALAVLTPRRLA